MSLNPVLKGKFVKKISHRFVTSIEAYTKNLGNFSEPIFSIIKINCAAKLHKNNNFAEHKNLVSKKKAR